MQSLRKSIFESLNKRFFYGWAILAVTSLIMFGTGPGQSHLIGLFFDPISEELNLSRTSIALAYGAATLLAAFLLPQLGRLVDRHGPATMLWIIAFLLGASCIAFGFASNWLYLAVGFGFLRFLGQGALMLNCANMVSHWFVRQRGFALGLMALGFPLSIALHPPIVQSLIETVGWRESWFWLGLATWCMLLPPILVMLHNKPEDLNLQPDGDPVPAVGTKAPAIEGITLHAALRTPAFYIIAAGLCSLSMLVTSLHVDYTGILVMHGLTAQEAANMFGVTGVTAAITMPIFGRMLDRFPTKPMFVVGLLIMAGSLFSITLVNGIPSAVIYAVIFGLNNGVTMTFFSFMWPRYFGRKHLGSIQGTGQMIGVAGASFGPLPLGFALDYFGEYDLMLRLLMLIPLGCAVLALFLKAPELNSANKATTG